MLSDHCTELRAEANGTGNGALVHRQPNQRCPSVGATARGFRGWGSKRKSGEATFDPVAGRSKLAQNNLYSNKRRSFEIPDEGFGGKISNPTQRSGS